jgi:DNA segregation ATPase FtsK/SpoIIIE-like protein
VIPTEEQIRQAAYAIGIHKIASTQLVQREVGVSYYMAKKILDELQRRGAVGPQRCCGKPRAILVKLD